MIQESVEELLGLERGIEKAKWRDRVRFLRHLKSGQASTTREAGELIGLSVRQGQRLWRRYREEGIRGFLENRMKGKPPLLNGEQVDQLEERLREDDIGTLWQAGELIHEKFGIRMSVPGVWFMFKRHGIKLKTGRPSNVRKDPEEEEAFKKTLI